MACLEADERELKLAINEKSSPDFTNKITLSFSSLFYPPIRNSFQCAFAQL